MAHDSMTAVVHQRVHVLDPELICSPTPETFGTGLRQVALLLHPSLAGTDGFTYRDMETKDPLE
jgi:iron complex transport system substrate-binding protein